MGEHERTRRELSRRRHWWPAPFYPWTHGPMDPVKVHGRMGAWAHGDEPRLPMDLWTHRPMDLLPAGSTIGHGNSFTTSVHAWRAAPRGRPRPSPVGEGRSSHQPHT